MTGTITRGADVAGHVVLGETLRPVLTTAMGSAIEIFDTTGPAEAGPPPHQHDWEETYVVLAGELEVRIGDADPVVIGPGDVAHVPAGTIHGYRNLSEAHFLTITTKGLASPFFETVATTVAMDPPDVPGIIRVGEAHGIEFSR